MVTPRPAVQDRRGRTWSDPPGKALMFSYLARPTRALAELSSLSLVVGIAVAESLPLPTQLRWPNDLVVAGGKVAGILVELVTPATGPPFAIIGIGINANLTRDELPPTDRLPATSLLVEGGVEIDRIALLESLAARLDAALPGARQHFYPGGNVSHPLRGLALLSELADALIESKAGTPTTATPARPAPAPTRVTRESLAAAIRSEPDAHIRAALYQHFKTISENP